MKKKRLPFSLPKTGIIIIIIITIIIHLPKANKPGKGHVFIVKTQKVK